PRREDREDCAQEILLRILTYLSEWQGRAAFCHWVKTIAHHHALDFRRRSKTHTARESTGAVSLQLEHDLIDSHRDVLSWESLEELRRTIRLVRAALARFSPEVRSKIRRAYHLRWRGMTW